MTSKFVDWTPYTNPETGQSGVISEGGQVRYNYQPKDIPDERASLDGLAEKLPEEFRSGPLWERIAVKAIQLHRAVYQRMVLATPAVMELIPAVLDTPEDFAKIGFNPVPGSGRAGISDPVFQATGVSAHMAASIASHVLSRAFVWAKRKVSGQTHMAESNPFREAAEFLAGLYEVVAKETGLTIDANSDTIEKALRDAQTTTKMTDAGGSAQLGQESQTALAGKDGSTLERLIDQSQKAGAKLLWGLVRDAVKIYPGSGPLFNAEQLDAVAERIAAVRATGELLGRARVREVWERALQSGGLSKFAQDDPLTIFSPGLPHDILTTPEEALAYFTSLVPKLGVDPERFPFLQRRRAFTLAESTNQVLTAKVQQTIAEGLKQNKSVSEVANLISRQLEDVGVNPKNPQYAEMVFRTNAMDAFQTGTYEEGRHEDVRDVFPVWQYLGIEDNRTGSDHRPKIGKYYPAHANFEEVRGERPFNCRCNLKWVDYLDWDELRNAGARLETRW